MNRFKGFNNILDFVCNNSNLINLKYKKKEKELISKKKNNQPKLSWVEISKKIKNLVKNNAAGGRPEEINKNKISNQFNSGFWFFILVKEEICFIGSKEFESFKEAKIIVKTIKLNK